MTITSKWVLTGAIFIATILLVSNLIAKKWNSSLSNLMSIGACLFILLSNAGADSLCMEGPKQSLALADKAVILGKRESDSGDFTKLGTAESQLSMQESKAAELESTMKDCEVAANFSQNSAIGFGAASAISSPPVSQIATGAAVASQGLSNSFSSTALDASRALQTTKQTIDGLKDMKST